MKSQTIDRAPLDVLRQRGIIGTWAMKRDPFVDPRQQHALTGLALLQNSWAPERHIPHEEVMILPGVPVIMNHSE